MALAPKLEIKQTQSLKLTPQLRQAISLLQMTNLELSEFVEQELSSNPLLEREDDILQSSEENLSEAETEEEFINDFDEQSSFDDFGSDTEGYNSFENADWSNYRQAKAHINADDDFDYISERLQSEKSLFDIIKEQIDLYFKDNREKIYAFILLEHLDASGYFTADLATIATKLKISISKLQKILNKMKQFEPSGIFAQNLAECLKIQLEDLGELSPSMQMLLDNLPLLAEQKYDKLCQLCDCKPEQIKSMVSKIKKLNPKPASAWGNVFNPNVIPDVIVSRGSSGEYRVDLNPLSLPKLLINHRYYAEIKTNKSASRYLKENMGRASFLIKAMHSRATSILRIAEEIVLRQYHFLEKGIDYLRPMTIKDLAETLDLSESTVSRASSGKYMATPIGTFELKYFFSNAAGSYLEGDSTSTTTIKHRIKKIIEAEDPKHILSDDNIVKLLENEGVKIARRTVAKYREALKIPTSAERKRLRRS